MLGAGKRFSNLINLLSTWLAVFWSQRAGGQFIPANHMIVPKGHATFNRKEAEMIGLNEAIILEEMRSWLAWNERNGKRSHCNEGQWWLYNSPTEWRLKHFPWWSESTIRRDLNKLMAANLVTCATYEKNSSRRWWTVGNVQSAPPNRKNYRQIELPFMQPAAAVLQNAPAVSQIDIHTGIESSQESSSSREGIHKQQQQVDTRAYKPNVTARDAAVAAFRDSQTPGNFSDRKTPSEAADAVDREQSPLPGQSAQATQQDSPPVPPPPSPALMWMRGFWTECTDTQLQEMLQRWGEARLLAEHDYAQSFDKPAGFARWRLQQGLPPPVAPSDESEVETTPDEPDAMAVAPSVGLLMEPRWAVAYALLKEEQPTVFDCLRGAMLLALNGTVCRIGVQSAATQQKLQLSCRDVQDALRFATGDTVEVQFEVMSAEVAA